MKERTGIFCSICCARNIKGGFAPFAPDSKQPKMEEQAINEMQHLGWLSEELVDKRGTPRIEHTTVDQSTKTADMLRADIKIEQEVAAGYGSRR